MEVESRRLSVGVLKLAKQFDEGGIERRTALGLVGIGAAAVVMARPVAAASGRLALETPADRLRAFMLMRGALDDRLVIGYLSGTYYGCVNGATTPMFGVVSATFSRYRPLRDGGVESVTVEQAYFIDLATNARLTHYANPYTGKTVEVPGSGYPPGRTIFTQALQMQVAKAMPGMVIDHQVTPFVVQGDDVWATEVTTVTNAAPRGLQEHFQEVVGLHARLGEMTAPGVKQVRCETNYTSVKSWRSWLQMDGHPGETVSTGAGRYGASVADLPEPWLAAARSNRPELIENPVKVLDALWRQA
jgi:hypothetical protein